jgi:hypothetical protein
LRTGNCVILCTLARWVACIDRRAIRWDLHVFGNLR